MKKIMLASVALLGLMSCGGNEAVNKIVEAREDAIKAYDDAEDYDEIYEISEKLNNKIERIGEKYEDAVDEAEKAMRNYEKEGLDYKIKIETSETKLEWAKERAKQRIDDEALED